MLTFAFAPNSEPGVKIRSIVFALLGVAVLLLKQHYAGPLDDVVHSYAGNLSVSFALYFVFTNLRLPTRIRKLSAALLALAAVELFEVFDGFGVTANTYDPVDFLANAVGIALGFLLDIKLGTVGTEHTGANTSQAGRRS